jgi:hypothetical protein
MFVVTTVLCVWLGWNVNIVRERKMARAAFERERWEFIGGSGLSWIRTALGDQRIERIVRRYPPRQDLTHARACFPEALVMEWEGPCGSVLSPADEAEYLRADPAMR